MLALIVPPLTLALRLPTNFPGSQVTQLEQALLTQAASDDARGTLRAFEALEQAAPAPDDLLNDAEAAAALDGRWALIATIAGQVGEEDLATSGVSGVVNASGLAIDASIDSKPVQVVDVAGGRIANEVKFDLPLGGGRAYVRVAGEFERAPPPAPARRALVEFDCLELFTAEGRRVLSLGWLFALIRTLRPALTNGADSSSWLETTYLSDRMRLGRGNKGSVFVLTRLDEDGPLPVDF